MAIKHCHLNMSNKTNELALLTHTIDELCDALKTNFLVDHFSCHLLFKEGRYLSLSNNPKTHASMIATGLVDDIPHIILNELACPGIHLLQGSLSAVSTQQSYNKFSKENNFNGCLYIIDIISMGNESIIAQFAFETKNPSHAVRFNLINNSDLLKQFCHYFLCRFKQRFSKLPKRSIDKKSFPNYHQRFDKFIEKSSHSKDKLRHVFSIWLHKHRLMQSKVSKPYLTKREKEILDLTCQHNFTSKQLAYHLKISKRTVDRHFENMRLKLNAIDKAELVHKAIAYTLIDNTESNTQ